MSAAGLVCTDRMCKRLVSPRIRCPAFEIIVSVSMCCNERETRLKRIVWFASIARLGRREAPSSAIAGQGSISAFQWRWWILSRTPRGEMRSEA